MKKTISLVITLVMLLSALSTAISANNTPPALPFEDLAENAWYVPGIEYVYENGIMTGMGNNKFAPAGNVTREQVMQVLLTFEAPATGAYEGNTGFEDVKVNQWYSRAIAWAKTYNITSGVSENIFGLGQAVTREQLATFIKNYLVHTGSEVIIEGSLDGFEDADKVSDWAKDGITFCVSNGIIQGKTETTLDPKGYATRAELAQMLSQFLEAGFLYRVDFDYNGADTRTGAEFKYIVSGTMFGTVPHAEKEGFINGGWWYGDIKVWNNTVLDISENITVTVRWSDGCKVYFDPDDGECDELSRVVDKGEALGELPIPTKEGFIFEGWLYENGEESYIVTAETVINEEGACRLIAQWTPKNTTDASM
ncbi:MAG: S-layer homology domain-containing protein [Clostridia bacterium]|nr:S-layer homology domain-containing protein [Clostridia bacterium]